MKIVMYSEHWNGFWCLPPHIVNDLQSQFPQFQIVHARDEDQIAASLPDAEVYFGYRLRQQEVDLATRLKWVHVPAASVHPLTNLGLQDKGVVVTNSAGLHAPPISEHVMGCMLVFSRKFLESWHYQIKNHYAAREILNERPLPGELRGKTVVILGLGGIGQQVARLSKCFGMRVVATRKRPHGKQEHVDQLVQASELRNVLPLADYLVIALPLTSETDRLLGEEELRLLKRSCVLINIARGTIVQQDALIRALKEGWIRGAALDVFETEPLPSSSELYQLPNVFLTPHTSGVSADEHWPRMKDLFAENLRRYIAGEEMLNVVNLAEGY